MPPNDNYPQGQAPVPAEPGQPYNAVPVAPGNMPAQKPNGAKKKTSPGMLIALVASLALIAGGVILGLTSGSSSPTTNPGPQPTDPTPPPEPGPSPSPGPSEPPEPPEPLGPMLPIQARYAFLDDRYEDGYRELTIDSDVAYVKGFTTDGTQIVTWHMPELWGNIPSENELTVYDIATGDEVRKRDDVAQCSGITRRDTVFCTTHVHPVIDGVTFTTQMTARSLIEINVLTGETGTEVELPVIGSQSLEYLGETNTHAYHYMASSQGFGSPTHYSVFATDLDSGEITWGHNFDNSDDAVFDCVVVNDGFAIACQYYKFSETEDEDAFSGIPYRIRSIDITNGEQIADTLTRGNPTMAENGWIDGGPLTGGGISIDGGSYEETLIYDYQGNDISDQYRQQLDSNIGLSTYVPRALHPFNDPVITYPLEAYMAGSSTNYFVVNAEGEVVVDTFMPLFGGMDLNVRRASDGETIFSGTPHAVTANGQLVLSEPEMVSAVATMYNVETGDAVFEIKPGGIMATLSIHYGAIVQSGDEATIVLLPGS